MADNEGEPVSEDRSLEQLEQVIQEGLDTFIKVGAALLAIRDGRLYRTTHPTFEAYCRERWGFSKSQANRLVKASLTVLEMAPFGVNAPPVTEAQARELARIQDPKTRTHIWEELRKERGDEPTQVTAEDIRRAAIQQAKPEQVRPMYVSNPPTEPLSVRPIVVPIAENPPIPVVAVYRDVTEVARNRYQIRLKSFLDRMTMVPAQFNAATAAEMIDEDFLRDNIEPTLEIVTSWVEEIRAAIPPGLYVIEGGRQ